MKEIREFMNFFSVLSQNETFKFKNPAFEKAYEEGKVEKFKSKPSSWFLPSASTVFYVAPSQPITIPSQNKKGTPQKPPVYFCRSLDNRELTFFSEAQVQGDGDCGFTTLGIERDNYVQVLLSLKGNEEDREVLSHEIYDALTQGDWSGQTTLWKFLWAKRDLETETFTNLYRGIRNELSPGLPEFKELSDTIDWLEKNNYQKLAEELKAADEEAESSEKAVRDYCKRQDVYETYVLAFKEPKKLWLSARGAKLYAREKRISFYVLTQSKTHAKELELTDSYQEDSSSQSIYMLHINKNHFNLLIQENVSAHQVQDILEEEDSFIDLSSDGSLDTLQFNQDPAASLDSHTSYQPLTTGRKSFNFSTLQVGDPLSIHREIVFKEHDEEILQQAHMQAAFHMLAHKNEDIALLFLFVLVEQTLFNFSLNSKGESLKDVTKIEAVDILLKKAREDEFVWPPTYQRFCQDEEKMRRELYAANISPNSKDKDGSTLLHTTILMRGYEMVKLLIQCGADPFLAKGIKGDMSYKYAAYLDDEGEMFKLINQELENNRKQHFELLDIELITQNQELKILLKWVHAIRTLLQNLSEYGVEYADSQKWGIVKQTFYGKNRARPAELAQYNLLIKLSATNMAYVALKEGLSDVIEGSNETRGFLGKSHLHKMVYANLELLNSLIKMVEFENATRLYFQMKGVSLQSGRYQDELNKKALEEAERKLIEREEQLKEKENENQQLKAQLDEIIKNQEEAKKQQEEANKQNEEKQKELERQLESKNKLHEEKQKDLEQQLQSQKKINEQQQAINQKHEKALEESGKKMVEMMAMIQDLMKNQAGHILGTTFQTSPMPQPTTPSSPRFFREATTSSEPNLLNNQGKDFTVQNTPNKDTSESKTL